MVLGMDGIDVTPEKLVMVSARRLDDVLELARLAVGRLPQDDPLTRALAGAVAETRLTAVVEP